MTVLQAEAFCSACRRVLPDVAAPGLPRRLVDALAEHPQGATTRELVSLMGRRFEAVATGLAELEAQGIVERFAERRGRAWNARPWRLAHRAPGAAWEPRQSHEQAGSELPPAVAELGFSAALTGALGARSVAGCCAFLAAAGLVVAGAVLEARALVPLPKAGARA